MSAIPPPLTPFINDAGQLQHVLDSWPDLLHCEHPADPDAGLRAVYYAQVAQSLARAPGHKTVALFVATAGPLAGAADNKPPAPLPPRAGRALAASEPRNRTRTRSTWSASFARRTPPSIRSKRKPAWPLPSWALSLATSTGGHALTRGNGDRQRLRSAHPRAGRNLHACLLAGSVRRRKLPRAQGHREPAGRQSVRTKPLLQCGGGGEHGRRRQAAGERTRQPGRLG